MAVTDEMVEAGARSIIRTRVQEAPREWGMHTSTEYTIERVERAVEAHWQAYKSQAIAALEAALSLPVSNTGEWQPIETAPKDGSWIIGYQPHKEVQDTVQLWAWKAFGCRDNIWVNAIDANDCDDQPTHWQPLPEAPNE